MDFAKSMCQPADNDFARSTNMKVNVEFDCTPEEARRLLGLPDVTKVNEAYTEATAKLMQGAGSFDQLQEMAKQIAPMGEMGLKMFQQLLAGGAAMAMGGKKKGE
jgi:hypothetical protein